MSNDSLPCPARRVKESFTKFDYYEESRKYKRRHVMMSRAVNRHMWERSCECDANIKIKVHSMSPEYAVRQTIGNNGKPASTVFLFGHTPSVPDNQYSIQEPEQGR